MNRRRRPSPLDGPDPLAASEGVAAALDGPARAVTVLAAFPAALYLAHPDGVVAVVTTDGVHLPNALVLPRPASTRPLAGIAPGTVGRLGGGRLHLGGLTAQVRRWWRPRPALRRVAAADLDQAVATLRDQLPVPASVHALELVVPLTRLCDALAAGERPAAVAAADGLLGRGPGLTPAGDDVLAGVLASTQLLAEAVGADPTDRLVAVTRDVGAAVAERAGRATTPISAALLHHAARGEVAVPVARLLRSLTGAGALAPALDDVLAVGATSGHDLAVGVLAGATLPLVGARAPDGTDRPVLGRLLGDRAGRTGRARTRSRP